MNTSAANTSTGSPPLPPTSVAVSDRARRVFPLQHALRPQPAPIVYVVSAANRLRDLTDLGRRGIRYIAAKDAPNTRFKRAATANRQWELTQGVYRFQGRRVA